MRMLDYSDENMYSEHIAKLVSWQRYYTRFYKHSLLFCDSRWPDFLDLSSPDKFGKTGEAEPRFLQAVTGDHLSFVDGMEIGPEDLESRPRHLDASGTASGYGPLYRSHLYTTGGDATTRCLVCRTANGDVLTCRTGTWTGLALRNSRRVSTGCRAGIRRRAIQRGRHWRLWGWVTLPMNLRSMGKLGAS